MLGKVAAFEFRYQVKSPLVWATALLLFVASMLDMAGIKLVSIGGGNVLSNSPHAIIVHHLAASLLFLFVGAAVVSNVIIRDDQSGFGPLIRATRIAKRDYLFGRFLGALAIGALIMAMVTLGLWLGSLAPFADTSLLGPDRPSAFLTAYGFFALPNSIIISAILFALATTTRSTAGTFIGVVGLFLFYLVGQRLMEGQTQMQTLRVLADPFGMSAYMAASRYLTADELNAGMVPIDVLLISSRLLWTGIAAALLALTYRLYRFTDRGLSRRLQARLARGRADATDPGPSPTWFARLPEARFDAAARLGQFAARARQEIRFVVRSPAFLILLAIALILSLVGTLYPTGFVNVALYPVTSVLIPIVRESFATILLVIAAYYGGELVWRERDRKIHEIIDATPLPAWALMLPKMLGLALVLIAALAIGGAVGMAVQAADGGFNWSAGDWLAWYLLPGAVDVVLVAILSVFIQALSPSKYAGWGVMFLYILLRTFGPSAGLEHPLWIFGNVPSASLFDMNGAGLAATSAWWFRLFWAAVAATLLVAVHLLWPRGSAQRLMPRLRMARARLKGSAGIAAGGAIALSALVGSWIVYNTMILNEFQSSSESERYYAAYEKRYFHFASLPQPTVRHVDLDVAIYPDEVRTEVRGRYRLVNETAAPIDRVHVRLMSAGLAWVDVDFPGAQLERDDSTFGYRIYRLSNPMQPGEVRRLGFHTRRHQRGFRAAATEASIARNGSNFDTLKLTPRIGMNDIGLIEDPASRRRLGLPVRAPLPRLEDTAATRVTPNGDGGWTTADITVSTDADQRAVAPGRKVLDRLEGGRRVARFVSTTPIKNLFTITSAHYAMRSARRDGVDYSVHYHPAHHWNVDRMLRAMQASMAYYTDAFGPYPFDHVRVVERPTEGGGQAFPGAVAISEGIFAMDLRDPGELDMVTMLISHELAHQWWGQQVLGARMQGASLLYESLAQYSALMVMKRLNGDAQIRRLLRFQLDRYLAGRRTEVVPEQPLIRTGLDSDHLNYGKGALALYLLQERMGEDVVNRVLRRYVAQYRFTTAPYPRSTDLIAMLRAEASTADQQALITDLFEQITLYDLKVDSTTATRRTDRRWDVSVAVTARKLYADGQGRQREAALDEAIDVGLFTAPPDGKVLRAQDVVRVERRRLKSGRQLVRFVTDRRPTIASVDPYLLHIDRNLGDNSAEVR